MNNYYSSLIVYMIISTVSWSRVHLRIM